MKRLYTAGILFIIISMATSACGPGMIFGPTTTPTSTNTSTYTPTYTSTNTPTDTPTFTPTNTPTITNTPTKTNTPTITNTPLPTPTATKIPGIGDNIQCGNLFNIMVVDIPIFTHYVFMETASGIYLGIRLNILYKGTSTLDHLADTSYSVSGVVNGQTFTFEYNYDASWSLAYDYGLKQSDLDQLVPGVPFRTYVGFDVNPDGKNWIFHFTPYDNRYNNSPICSVDIPLVK